MAPVYRPTLIAALFALSLISARREAHGSGPDSGQPREVFDVFGDGDALLVPVRIRTRTWLFLLDTGATITIFDQRLKEHLRPTDHSLSLETAHGRKSIALYELGDDLFVGSLPVKPRLPIGADDLTPLREVLGYEIYGVLGIDALSSSIIHVDFEQGKLSFLNAGSDASGDRVSMHYGGSAVDVAATSVLGTQSWVVDTGFVGTQSCSLSTVDFDLLERKRSKGLVNVQFSTDASGVARGRSARLGEVSLPGVCLRELVAGEHLQCDRNILGLAFWSRFNVTFDFPSGVMYLQKNRNFNRSDRLGGSGARFIRRHGKTLVDMVDRESPADAAGLQARDVIVSVNDEDASSMRLFVLGGLCATPGGRIKMVVERDGRQVEMEMRLPEESD